MRLRPPAETAVPRGSAPDARPQPIGADRPAHRAALATEMRAAAGAIGEVLAGQRLPEALQRHMAALPPASRAPARDMAYQALRNKARVTALTSLLNGRAPDRMVLALQWVALAQLLEPMRAQAIVVDQAVAAARAAFPAAAGFLNATLRRFLREQSALLAAIEADPVVRYEHPKWWLDELARAYPSSWQAIVAAAHRQAPLVLRVNRRRTDREACAARLALAGIQTRVAGPDALVLDKALAVEAIPGFEQGEWSVQDAGAQLAAHLLDVQDGQRVLDACAAPGGKTCHLLERADIDLLSLDVDAQRCQRIESNIDRLGLPMPGSRGAVRVLAGDAATPATWWDGIAFDRILLDAPCTASGIVRRHPDIRWLRRRGDIATLSQQQSRLLTALWPLLKPGGKLLFSTCSVFPGEGAEVIDRFVQQTPTAQRESINWTWPDGRREAISQLLPCTSPDREHDGFFYALLSKGQ